ncbi:LADA_0G04434g1_1 [Lachancea dasiensis]|uniref:Methionyl-tRNA formyltransferase, mitochondrial n=1 Tax=Lachancea dasiensis TaxID=1072105 RepID=A0A1G4JS80_9SACH|nr:LADA_0G04434g1_1 [Lachancea dasiensis]
MSKSFQTWIGLVRPRRCYSDVKRPLNILFFGSDQFSVHSLKALHKLKEEDPHLIRTLQVVTRPAKKCGRNLSVTRDVPIAKYSTHLGLPPVIECDSQQDMLGPVRDKLMEGQFNMIIAVSFGKLISKKLLAEVPYTLNVHPSLLPRYKGSSPIQYTLLNQDAVTGVSIQTLHPEKFDCGRIIAQTPPLRTSDLLLRDGLQIHEPSYMSESAVPPKVAKLMDVLGDIGSELLVRVIREGAYKAQNIFSPPFAESFAPKITTDLRQIQWNSTTSQQALSKIGALGPVYSFKAAQRKSQEPLLKRVIFHKLKPCTDTCGTPIGQRPGSFYYDDIRKCILVRFVDGTVLQCPEIQFEGSKIEGPEQFSKSLRKRCGRCAQEAFFL